MHSQSIPLPDEAVQLYSAGLKVAISIYATQSWHKRLILSYHSKPRWLIPFMTLHFIITPSHSTCTISPNYPGTEFVLAGTAFKQRKKKKQLHFRGVSFSSKSKFSHFRLLFCGGSQTECKKNLENACNSNAILRFLIQRSIYGLVSTCLISSIFFDLCNFFLEIKPLVFQLTCK